MTIGFRSGLVALLLTAVPSHVFADAEKARLASVMWAAFQCGTYAELAARGQMQAHYKERQLALYNYGIESGRAFLKALRANEITPKELKNSIPIGVMLRLGGPSDDFMVGRFFEGAVNDANDKIVKKDDMGLPLKMDKWIMSDALRAIKAETEYRRSNCGLVDRP